MEMHWFSRVVSFINQNQRMQLGLRKDLKKIWRYNLYKKEMMPGAEGSETYWGFLALLRKEFKARQHRVENESLLVNPWDRDKADRAPLLTGIYFFYCHSLTQEVGHSMRGRNIQDLYEKGERDLWRAPVSHFSSLFGFPFPTMVALGVWFILLTYENELYWG